MRSTSFLAPLTRVLQELLVEPSESFRKSEMTDIAWKGGESPRVAVMTELRVLMKDKWRMFAITFTFKFQRFVVTLSSTTLRDHTVSRTEVRLVTVVD